MSLVRPLLDACRPLLAAIDEPMAADFVTLIERLAGAPAVEGGAPFPLGDFPDLASLASDATRPAIHEVASVADRIDWFQSSSDRVPPGWNHNSGACQLISPEDGIVLSPDSSRLGLFYIAPNTHYPDHWHAAEEFYLVLAGEGDWTIGDDSLPAQQPGGYLRTPTMVKHAITTRDKPMFALWGWAGETSMDSYSY